MKDFFRETEQFWIWLARLSTPLLLAGLLFFGDQRYVTKEFLSTELKPITAHATNPDLHMSYQRKVNEFVTRREFERFDDELKNNIDEIKASVLRMEQKIDRARP